jgi:hypothetical protein
MIYDKYYYKYLKYKNKYLKLKYYLNGGTYDNDIIYLFIGWFDSSFEEVSKIMVDDDKFIENINKLKSSNFILQRLIDHDEFINNIEHLQILILCIICSIIFAPTTFINIFIELLNEIINKKIPGNLLKIIVPCSSQIINSIEKIIHLYYIPKDGKPIDLGPLHILLILLNLFTFDSDGIHSHLMYLNKLEILKKYKILESLNIQGGKIDLKLNFNTFTINFSQKIIQIIDNISNTLLLKQTIDVNTKLINDLSKGAIIAGTETGKAARKASEEFTQATVNIYNSAHEEIKKLDKGWFGLFRGGGTLQIQFIHLKEIQLFDLIIQLLKSITTFNIPNIILISIRLILKFIKDNIEKFEEIIFLKYTKMFIFFYNIIDSILCFLLLINNITQVIINILKIIITKYLGDNLNGLSKFICNFIQSIFDIIVNHKCLPSIINMKGSDIYNAIKEHEKLNIKKKEEILTAVIKTELTLQEHQQPLIQSPPRPTPQSRPPPRPQSPPRPPPQSRPPLRPQSPPRIIDPTLLKIKVPQSSLQ